MGDIVFWILIAVGIIASTLFAIFLIGCFLPKGHQVARAIALTQKPEVIWSIITDYGNVPGWQLHVLKVEKQPDQNGHEVWKETYQGNYGLFLKTTEATAPTRLVRTITDDGGPFTGRWEFAIAASETGSRLTITEFGEIPNPFFRVMFRLFMKPETYVEMYLAALAKKFNEVAAIEK